MSKPNENVGVRDCAGVVIKNKKDKIVKTINSDKKNDKSCR